MPLPFGSITGVSGILDRPPQCASAHKADDDDWIWLRVLAALIARDLHLRWSLQNSEGAGKTGCLLHPRSRVRFCA